MTGLFQRRRAPSRTTDDYARLNDPVGVALADRIDVLPDPRLDYLDAVVSVGSGAVERNCRTADLPWTLVFRNHDEQRRVSEAILGPEGGALVDTLVQADDESPAKKILNEALQTFHQARDRT